MRYLIVSDIHNRWDNLAKAIEIGKKELCEVLLCAGDTQTPHVLAELYAFPGEIHMVYGNNDIAHFIFAATQLTHPRVKIHGEEMTLTTDHGSIYMSHYPEDADHAAATGMHTLCIHGHTHKKRHEQKGTTTIINPGEVCGAKTGEATCAIFDSETGHHGFFVLN